MGTEPHSGASAQPMDGSSVEARLSDVRRAPSSIWNLFREMNPENREHYFGTDAQFSLGTFQGHQVERSRDSGSGIMSRRLSEESSDISGGIDRIWRLVEKDHERYSNEWKDFMVKLRRSDQKKSLFPLSGDELP